MTKYAYTVEIYRHVDQFVGPFDSRDKMMKDLETLVLEDDAGIGDRIQDDIMSKESPEDTVHNQRIRIFRIEEEEVNCEEVYFLWKSRAIKHDKEMRKMMEEQQEERERREYERLKKKYG